MFDSTIKGQLRMRMIEKRHSKEFYDLISENKDHFSRWLTWTKNVEEISDAAEFIQRYLDKFADSSGILVGLWHKDKLIGTILIREIDHTVRSAEIGFFIDEGYQGRGWVTLMCKAMIAYIFEDLDMNKVTVQCASGNDRSMAVPRRLNFKQEGIIRQSYDLYGNYVDMHIFGLLKKEYVE